MQRVALIGCGFFAPNHIHAWLSLEEAELVAVSDLDQKRAQAAALLAGNIPYFTDPERLLDEVKPDVVDIVTTAASHLALARLCANRRIPAIIQKPLALEFAEAAEIAQLATQTGTPMMVHENFRFQQPIRAVKKVIDSGAIGQLHYCRIGFRSGYDIFKGQPYLRTVERLALMDNGVHVFDVARFLMGEIKGLSCQTQRVRLDVRGEDMASALVKFESGAMGVVEVSWGSFLPDDPFPETLLAVEGSKGSVTLDRRYSLSLRSGESITQRFAEPAGPSWGKRPWHVVQDSVVHACQHWLETAEGKASLETSVQDNVRTMSAVEACYLSARRQGAFVTVDEVFASLARLRGADADGG